VRDVLEGVFALVLLVVFAQGQGTTRELEQLVARVVAEQLQEQAELGSAHLQQLRAGRAEHVDDVRRLRYCIQPRAQHRREQLHPLRSVRVDHFSQHAQVLRAVVGRLGVQALKLLGHRSQRRRHQLKVDVVRRRLVQLPRQRGGHAALRRLLLQCLLHRVLGRVQSADGVVLQALNPARGQGPVRLDEAGCISIRQLRKQLISRSKPTNAPPKLDRCSLRAA